MKAIKTTIAQAGPSLYIKALICAILSGAISLVLLLLIFSCVLLISGTLPHDYLIWMDIAACCATAYISSYIALIIIKSGGLLWGTITGAILFFIQFFAGLLGTDENITYITLIKLISFLFLGAIGGIMAVNKKDKIRIK